MFCLLCGVSFLWAASPTSSQEDAGVTSHIEIVKHLSELEVHQSQKNYLALQYNDIPKMSYCAEKLPKHTP